jgi:hypothetical protein
MGQIDAIAEKIYDSEFYEDDAEESEVKSFKARISAWLETNIGLLNILIHKDYRIDAYLDVDPALQPEEIAIYIQLYLKEYYKRQSQLALKNVTSSTTTTTTGESSFTMSEWTELREGDSSIKRQSLVSTPQQKIQAAQAYKSIANDADIKLKELVHYYNSYNAQPRQVLAEDSNIIECLTSRESSSKDCNEKCCPEGTEQYKLGDTENQEFTDKCGYIVRFSNINPAAYEGLVCLSIEKPENHEDQKSFNVEVNVSGEKMFDLYGNGSIENKNIYFYKK